MCLAVVSGVAGGAAWQVEGACGALGCAASGRGVGHSVIGIAIEAPSGVWGAGGLRARVHFAVVLFPVGAAAQPNQR